MFLSKVILTAITLIGSINAAILKSRSSLERRATQSCKATDHLFWVSYSVLILVPFGGATACDNTYNHLYNTWGVQLSNWQCLRTGDGNTQLWFNAPYNDGGWINSGLGESYPTVDSFNCPDY